MEIEDVDRVFQTLGDNPAADQDRWNEFLNLLIQGGPLYTVVTGGIGGIAVFADRDDAQPVMFACTSLEEARLAQLPEDKLGLRMLPDFLAVAKAIPVVGVVVNPATKGIVIPSHLMFEMERFMTGPRTRTVAKDSVVHIGEPANFPQALVDDLALEAANHKAVKRMWIRQMVMEDEASYYIVIDAPERDEDVLRALGAVVNAHPELSQPVDFSMKPTTSMTDSCSGPFYVRKRRGLFG